MGTTNLKGMYFEKAMGDGTNMKIVRLRRPDDENWALALQLRAGTKTATCFLEDVDGIPFVQELADALIDYLEDLSNIEIEQMEQDGEAFILRKEEEAKKKKKIVKA